MPAKRGGEVTRRSKLRSPRTWRPAAGRALPSVTGTTAARSRHRSEGRVNSRRVEMNDPVRAGHRRARYGHPGSKPTFPWADQVLPEPGHQVDLWQRLAQLVSVSLGHAAGDDEARPPGRRSASSRMVSIDSCRAASMNAHVLTTTRSADSGSAAGSEALRLEVALQLVGVDLVLRAPQGLQPVTAHDVAHTPSHQAGSRRGGGARLTRRSGSTCPGELGTGVPARGAEREGFEPSDPVTQVNSLAVSPIRPLSHLSVPVHRLFPIRTRDRLPHTAHHQTQWVTRSQRYNEERPTVTANRAAYGGGSIKERAEHAGQWRLRWREGGRYRETTYRGRRSAAAAELRERVRLAGGAAPTDADEQDSAGRTVGDLLDACFLTARAPARLPATSPRTGGPLIPASALRWEVSGWTA